ncbi:hypothetical protein [Aeromonas sp.]|uniref:hypothetical protein n=1 Tax=Aeromonas sp. TaxID=647 RepID=UPI002584DCDF|nr:hypothetical protein [Aeromonas sp.]MCX7131401.1 hypothetical protein [Aeromonas sp.]
MFLVQATALIWLKGPPWCGKRAAMKSSSSPIFQQDANIDGVNKVAFSIFCHDVGIFLPPLRSGYKKAMSLDWFKLGFMQTKC